MNILIISHMFPTEYRPSYGRFVLDQAIALKKLGHNVIVISPQAWIPKHIPFLLPRWKANAILPKMSRIAEIKVYYLKSLVEPKARARNRGVLHYWQHLKFFNKIIAKYNIDLIHAHTILIDGHLAIRLKQKYQLPVVVTIHGSDLTVALKKRKDKKRVLKTVSLADRIVLVSKKLKQQLEKHLSTTERQKLSVIYNGFEPEDVSLIPDWKEHQKSFKIVSVGSLTKQKNYSMVFAALKQLKKEIKNVKFFIIGDGWHRSFYENEIKRLRLDKDVILLGNLSHEHTMAYLKNTDLFILTSINEGFGIAYLEAMYYSKIVIGSKGEAIEEVITNDVNGYLVSPFQPKELVKQIRYIFEHLNEMSYIGEQAHKTVWPAFSWQNNAKKYVKLFTQILSSENNA